MKLSVFVILLLGCKLASAQYERFARREVAQDDKFSENWYNMDEELDTSHPDLDHPAQFSFDLHMAFPPKSETGEKIAPVVKNPMWIDKLAIIKAPPMYSTAEEYDPIAINYRPSKIRERRSTQQQQQSKKTTRQSEKKSKFKAWLESKMDKKLGEKFSEKLKLKKPAFSRQTRSVDQNDVASEMTTEQNVDNRINRSPQESTCSFCQALHRQCPHCQAAFLLSSVYQPRPQFIEFINGEPRSFIPGVHHSAILGAAPRYVFDQLGHKYLEREGNLQILPPPYVESAMQPSFEYKILYDTMQKYPHFHTSQRLEDGSLTDSPIKQTQDVIEFIKTLVQSKEKSHQKRQTKEKSPKTEELDEAIVDEEGLLALFLEQDREFDRYLEEMGYAGKVEMFDMEGEENAEEEKTSMSQSIFYDTSKSTSNKLQVPSAKKQQNKSGILKRIVDEESLSSYSEPSKFNKDRKGYYKE